MKVNLTPEELIRFEEGICDLFSQKRILAPIHLDNGNENQLIEVFEKYVDEEDWVCGTWRQHYKCLLKGVPQDNIIKEIMEGKSISLCFPEYKVISSAIVGGIIPIAMGLAAGIKRKCGGNKVVCFVGDMSSETGAFHECQKYSLAHNLPLLFVLENNNKSVCTDTRKSWGVNKLFYEPDDYVGGVVRSRENVLYFTYESKYPHAGVGGARIQF